MQTDPARALTRNRTLIIAGAIAAVLALVVVIQVSGNRPVNQVEQPAEGVEEIQPNWILMTRDDAMRGKAAHYAVTESVTPLRTTYGVSKMWLLVPSGGDEVLLFADTALQCGQWTVIDMKIDSGEVERGACRQTYLRPVNEASLMSITIGDEVDRGPLLPRLLTAERLIVELPSSLGRQQVEFNVSGLTLP
ncbi:hypothetical protein [uncultured Brevundimonas sp.]|uniref:hypothetical protein n=1 Tax=uncultured Brevundimonas sp. TaxID=213418 RepID=UPI0025DCAF70|nr:hypothetical protein [uncultured Brevundimonas sp.]